jgi:hypothetical protein
VLHFKQEKDVFVWNTADKITAIVLF